MPSSPMDVHRKWFHPRRLRVLRNISCRMNLGLLGFNLPGTNYNLQISQ
jgi:hypothetical protein